MARGSSALAPASTGFGPDRSSLAGQCQERLDGRLPRRWDGSYKVWVGHREGACRHGRPQPERQSLQEGRPARTTGRTTTGTMARTGSDGAGRNVEWRRERRGMKVWIDQDLCTGDGLCEEIAPAVFTLLDDGLAYVKEGDSILNEPGGSGSMALVPEDLEDAVVEASEECPGECIFIERD